MNISPTKKLVYRIAGLSWLLILMTLMIFIFATIPYQESVLVERMRSEAKDIASSISQVTASAIIAEDYSFALEHCINVVQQSNSILMVNITKKDGFSLIILDDGWRMDTLSGIWNSDNQKNQQGVFTTNEFVNQELFHYSYPFSYSGIEWGWIHIGLSLEKYNQGTHDLFLRTMIISIISSFIGLIASIYLARNISKPILELNIITKKVAEGDFSARSDVKTGDEIEALSHSFNSMTQSLYEAQSKLETRVKERTAELATVNESLEKEIIERKKAEEIIQSSLDEKVVLLKEIHHRVKNNLQIISSLLFLQSKNIKDEKILSIFKDSQTRVKTMALVHEKLYQSKTLSHIEFSEYLKNLTSFISNSYSKNNIRIILDVKEIYLNIDIAIPCGLIINELLSNSMKYAFPESYKIDYPEIKLDVKKLDGLKYIMVFSDNGIGISNDFKLEESNSLGMQLVSNLVRQIDGELNIHNNSGLEFIISFEDKAKVRT